MGSNLMRVHLPDLSVRRDLRAMWETMESIEQRPYIISIYLCAISVRVCITGGQG